MFFRVRFVSMLDSWKRFKISTALLSVHNIMIINLFRQAFNVPKCSAQRKIFVIGYMLQISLIAVIAIVLHYQRELTNLAPIGHLLSQSQQ